jgi:hypothetical protein
MAVAGMEESLACREFSRQKVGNEKSGKIKREKRENYQNVQEVGLCRIEGSDCV